MPGLRTTKRCNRSLSRQSPTLGLDGINTLLSLSLEFSLLRRTTTASGITFPLLCWIQNGFKLGLYLSPCILSIKFCLVCPFSFHTHRGWGGHLAGLELFHSLLHVTHMVDVYNI